MSVPSLETPNIPKKEMRKRQRVQEFTRVLGFVSSSRSRARRNLNAHGEVVLDAWCDTRDELLHQVSHSSMNISQSVKKLAHLQEYDEVLIHPDSHLLVVKVMTDLFPLVTFALVCCSLGHVELIDLIN